jgi:hypothetical protein
MANDDVLDVAAANADLDSIKARETDALLAQRCIRGEVAAWEELYHRCHEPLCRGIGIRLGRLANDANLVDEIAARVWYALVDKDGERLLRYDPRRGAGILTFMKIIAREELSEHFRSEQRRLKHELNSLTHHKRAAALDRGESVATSLSEFLAKLSPLEQGFCSDYLLATGREDGDLPHPSYSSANIWQLTRRVYKKFLRYLGRDR